MVSSGAVEDRPRHLLRALLVRRPTTAEWVLVAYLAVVSAVSLGGHYLGLPDVRALASTPDDVASGRLWPLLSSGLVTSGALVPQIAATLVLGGLAIRLAGGAVFWVAAVLAHVLGTLLVYAGVWIGDSTVPHSVATLVRQSDYGISLVWCAAFGVLAAVGWWNTAPMTRWGRGILCVWPAASLVVISVASDGLALYEHIVAFLLAAAVVGVARRWRSARPAVP